VANDHREPSDAKTATRRDLYGLGSKGQTRWATVNEVAEMLSITPRTVYRMIESGTLPGVKFGEGRRQNVRIPLEALEDWMMQKETRAREITKTYGNKARLG
jgi:excisionase family DNA binding protein